MIPVLRSIDTLLNRFDELSQRHASLVANLDTNFTNTRSPSYNVASDEDEQRKTPDNLLNVNMKNNDQLGSVETVDDFNQRITNYERPSYSSNESTSFVHRIQSRSSWTTTESVLPRPTLTVPITQRPMRTSHSPIASSISTDDLIGSKKRVKIKTKPKFSPQNPPTMRRNERSIITTFTMETAIRLSRPRTYRHLPEPTITQKRVHRRPRPSQAMKKEASLSSIASIPVAPPSPLPPKIKRTNPTLIISSPKKHKAENKSTIDNSKRIPINNYPRSITFLAPPPTICLTFPMQPELKLSRIVVTPKANPITPVSPKKTISVFTNKRSIILPNRFKYLMA